ncbi:MAG: GntR family transcriptional regulator [Gammaproteobacteria bacterium]|nr:MAG: GntR family transcriptional regulator [Gammaproteobacteria bacterium]
MALPTAAARYLQVKHFVLERISAGALRAGQRVPSENELVRELDVSRMTANRALRELAADGVLIRVAGVGTFVAEQRVHAHPLEVRNIADEIRARGHEHFAKVATLDSVSAPRELAERCGVSPGAKLDHSLVIHFGNDFSRTTPHEFLMQAAPLQRAEHTVRAVAPEGRIRRLLKLEPGDACLLIMRRTWTHGRIVSVADLYHPGSRYELAGTFQPR